MILLERETLRDRDGRNALLCCGSVETLLYIDAHRTRALIEDGKFGLMPEEARHRQALLLTQGEHILPLLHRIETTPRHGGRLRCGTASRLNALVFAAPPRLSAHAIFFSRKSLDETLDPDEIKQLNEPRFNLIRALLGRDANWVGDLIREGTDDGVALLRYKKHSARPRSCRLDHTARQLPEPSEDAEERALAAPIRTRNDERLARSDGEGEISSAAKSARSDDINALERKGTIG